MSQDLSNALRELAAWRRMNEEHKGRCLEAVRWALGRHGLRLPGPFLRPRNTALCCFEELSHNPQKWDWHRWTHADHPGEALPVCLVFFKDCGILADGRIAGHVAVYDPATATHSANSLYRWNKAWASKLVGAFVME